MKTGIIWPLVPFLLDWNLNLQNGSSLLKPAVSLKPALQITALTMLLCVASVSYGLSTGEKPQRAFVPTDTHEANKNRSQADVETPTADVLIPDGAVISKKPNTDARKKKKKLSNLERLRQLYLLPLLQPLVSGRR